MDEIFKQELKIATPCHNKLLCISQGSTLGPILFLVYIHGVSDKTIRDDIVICIQLLHYNADVSEI